MTTSRPKGRRLGGPPPTLSTTEDTTPPEVPPVPPAAAPRQDLVPAAPPLPAQAPPAEPPPAPPRNVTAQQPAQPPERPRAEDLVTRRTHIEREQLNGQVPRVLQLRRRMTLYQLDNGMEMRDQIAVAMDTWLRSQGY